MFKKLKQQHPAETETPAAPPVVASPVEIPVAAAPVVVAPTTTKALYEIDDLASLDDAEVSALTQKAEHDAAAGLAPCAHLVVTQDLGTGVVNHHVPCSSGLEALTLARQVVSEKRAVQQGRPFTVKVTPLLPHTEG